MEVLKWPVSVDEVVQKKCWTCAFKSLEKVKLRVCKGQRSLKMHMHMFYPKIFF